MFGLWKTDDIVACTVQGRELEGFGEHHEDPWARSGPFLRVVGTFFSKTYLDVGILPCLIIDDRGANTLSADGIYLSCTI